MSSATRTFSFILLSCAFAVAQKPTSGPPSGGSTTGPSTPTNTTTSIPTRTTPPIRTTPQAPIILTGNVVMDDGTVPTERVSIERVCNGRPWREGYTDSKGYFSITVGGGVQNTVLQDASADVNFDGSPNAIAGPGMAGMNPITGGQTSASPLFGCELRAALPGTLSDMVELSDRRSMSDPNVGTIVLHRIGKVDGSTISVTSLKAPKDAKKAFESGRKELKKDHSDKAEAAFAHAVEVYPEYADAWAQLGEIYLHQKLYDKADDAAKKAIGADAHFVTPYFTLISTAANRQDWKSTEDYSDKLLALDAYHYPAAYYFNALASFQLREGDKALKSIQLAKKYDIRTSLPKISLLMGEILVARGDYAGAVQAYKAFLEREPQGSAADFARKAMNDAQTKVAAAAPVPKSN